MTDHLHTARRGFSMLEVAMTLAILATVATIAVPRYSGAVLRYRVDLAANRIARDLEYAAARARVTSTEITINFVKGDEPDESYYWFEGVDDPDRPETPYTVVLRTDPYRVILTSAPGDIKFDIHGLPDHDRTFILDAGPHRRTVLIDEQTGEVTIQ